MAGAPELITSFQFPLLFCNMEISVLKLGLINNILNISMCLCGGGEEGRSVLALFWMCESRKY